MAKPLWQPSLERTRRTSMAGFMAALEKDWNVVIGDYGELYRFSIDEMEKFWRSFKDYAGIIAETWGETVLVDAQSMPGAKWFPEARLNFAENLLKRRDKTDALVFWSEDKVRRRLSRGELYRQVCHLNRALAAMGVGPGDRVAGYLPNMPETVIAMLAATSLGAVWSSCSPDFGASGVIERFSQIEPKVLFAADGYHYNGKVHDCLGKLEEILEHLPSVKTAVLVSLVRPPAPGGMPSKVQTFESFIAGFEAGDINFKRLAFDHPLYIMYSSGTTGVPKCIVHGAGGTLLQHMKEHLLHCDIKPADRVFYFTTCGWMMWNWLVSALACEATVLLYDGSPFYPDASIFFDYADAEDMTLFGASAKYLDAINKAGLEPINSHRLERLETITSTGSPLAPESFDFVYEKIKRDVLLASISGGTDIIACFVGGNPTGPVWRGEIQARCLGMAVEVFDDGGKPLRRQKGELVCTAPFPSIPVGFWNDDGGEKYRSAYFDKFPGVWCHGDYVELTEHGGVIIHGRSDTTLNPGGVRIGTAEIYRQVEQLDEVVESIAIGQDWEGDVRIILFVVLSEGIGLDGDLTARIKSQICRHCTPRHVPAKVVQVADIPRTKSGKITELAVRDTVHGRKVKNTEALANPEALEFFRDLAELWD